MHINLYKRREKLDSSGAETALHKFSGSDGACPVDELLRDHDGNLYGTTLYGGSGGIGTAWKLEP